MAVGSALSIFVACGILLVAYYIFKRKAKLIGNLLSEVQCCLSFVIIVLTAIFDLNNQNLSSLFISPRLSCTVKHKKSVNEPDAILVYLHLCVCV
ncbi:hypothetical protein NC653_012506 [Populus alba x Populus x berolinensis]|uniref:Uncharacterized protein n=1 Tax=Populus alba x Populus x berolinensis TaxID=444605 RepID=A0AAD6W1G9_9ROSI|nr:hypothetical protein NC653_012506 [Populus alba x Populus x berolinensis]